MPITTPYIDDEAGGRQKQRKTVIRQPRTKTNTIRQARSDWSINARSRQRRHDPKTPAQMIVRNAMKSIKAVYDSLTYQEHLAWGETSPQLMPLLFFRVNLARVLDDLPIIRTPL
ncbi:MAG TPA: hypothetical protein VMZ31_19685 [Phycisphaerae bacterium]|nr:hypothetical protein [Phycisphaerae bacterium]